MTHLHNSTHRENGRPVTLKETNHVPARRDPRAQLHPGHRYAYMLKAEARRRGWRETERAADLAVAYHIGQTRKAGGPFAAHPGRVATLLRSLGVENDNVVAAALLHDVPEDTDATTALLSDFHDFAPFTVQIVEALTKHETISEDHYYKRIQLFPEARLVKLADRIDNLATMPGAKTHAKMRTYLCHTETYVLPLLDPNPSSYSQTFRALELHYHYLLNLLRHFLDSPAPSTEAHANAVASTY